MKDAKKTSRKEGIDRVLQKDNKAKGAQSGAMHMHGDKAHWTRSGESLTPRKA